MNDRASPPAGDIPARAYGPGLPSAGQAVVLTVSTAGLRCRDDSVPRVPAWPRLRARRGGFNDGTLYLEWDSPEGPVSLTIDDATASQQVLAHLPRPAESRRENRATRRMAWLAIALLVGVPLLLVGVIVWQSGRIVDWAVSRIPPDVEMRLGREAFEQQRGTLELAEDHPALPMLRELGARLTQGSVYTYEFHVARDDAINAFAMPGGFIVFHSGLLAQADSAEEVAGVLAHEIQHVERRHALRGLVHAAGWRAMLAIVLGDTTGSLASGWIVRLGDLRFSRSQETEADRLGIERLVAHEIDPHGMAVFFRKLSREGPNVPAWLSTHPSSEERFLDIESRLPDATRFPPLPYDYTMIKARQTR